MEPSIEELKDLAAGAEGAGFDCKTGRYELFGIVTHQGRTAEGGHYVAWLKKDHKKWLVFDDETVAEVDALPGLALSPHPRLAAMPPSSQPPSLPCSSTTPFHATDLCNAAVRV